MMSDSPINMEAEADPSQKCRTFKMRFGKIRINLNPVVSGVSAFLIWGFVAWCIIDPERTSDYMSIMKTWISDHFTWFYIGVENCWLAFLVVVYCSKYSNLKLGKDDEEPEFSDASYFTMLFAAGVGIGLFYFGVAEPVYHYEPRQDYGNRYWGRYTDNQRAQDSINITYFHWGFHAWVVYSLVGLCMAFVCYRKNLPMTIRSCFHPLIGDSVYGIAGDVIDIMSIVSTMFGVCTTLGMGAMTLNSGLNRINSAIAETTTNQIIIIWGVTSLATISVITGIKLGIRRLSELCFGIGVFIMLIVFFYDKTFFILNLYIQSIGYYIQNFIQLGFHTDAFAQLGNAPDGKENPLWLNGWTIFYWGWWISWSPFVGMFIAKISRGRTIKSFINATITAPILYSFMWFAIFGGAGLNMERNAKLKGINCSMLLGGTNATEPYEKLFRLSCRGSTQMFFDLIQQYGNLGGFLNILAIAAIILYFVTSSDSGSLVIDCLSANGNPDPPIIQRVFWALTEGACATALLKSGGQRALEALQTVAIAAGLPYSLVVSAMCVGLWRAFKESDCNEGESKNTFNASLGDVFVNPSWNNVKRLVIAVLAPWWPAGQAAAKLYHKSPISSMAIMAFFFYGWVLLEVLQVVDTGLAYVGWVVLFGFLAYVVGLRIAVREAGQIAGSGISDCLFVLFLYPLVVDQLEKHLKIEEQQKKDDNREVCLANKSAVFVSEDLVSQRDTKV